MVADGGWLLGLGAALVLSAPLAGAADVLKWTDAAGQVHFGDSAPPTAAAEVVVVKPNVYQAPSLQALDGALPAAAQVVIYSAEWCGHCKRAKRYFEAHGITYVEYDVERSARGRRDYKRLGARGVPVIVVGRQRMNGFSAAAFAELYAAHGSP